MGNWVAATDYESSLSGYVNLDEAVWAYTSGSDEIGWTVWVQDPANGSEKYKFAGSPYATQADALAAIASAAAKSSTLSLTVSGTNDYSG